MSGTAVPLSNTANGNTIVSQVLSPSSEPGQVISSLNPVQKFLKGWPKTLGTVQIMTGLLALILGIVLAVISPYHLFIIIPAFVMASVYLPTGILTAAAGYKLRLCLVNATLVINVISSVAAGTAIILSSLYFVFVGWRRWNQDESIIATLLIISIIQFIISICVSSFACRATCSPGPYVNITVVANPEGGSMVNPFPVHHNGEYPLSTVNTTTVNSLPTENPPPYIFNVCKQRYRHD
ncbi:hypothetical protein NFI96_034114 [Prochilodus magdalenae]|nr:hypothetical protein NFI96_034114 [Prochilodus magdalenae]